MSLLTLIAVLCLLLLALHYWRVSPARKARRPINEVRREREALERRR